MKFMKPESAAKVSAKGKDHYVDGKKVMNSIDTLLFHIGMMLISFHFDMLLKVWRLTKNSFYNMNICNFTISVTIEVIQRQKDVASGKFTIQNCSFCIKDIGLCLLLKTNLLLLINFLLFIQQIEVKIAYKKVTDSVICACAFSEGDCVCD